MRKWIKILKYYLLNLVRYPLHHCLSFGKLCETRHKFTSDSMTVIKQGRHLRLDSSQARSSQLPQAIPPKSWVDAEVVDGATGHPVGLTIEEETVRSGHQSRAHTAFGVMLIQSGQLRIGRCLQRLENMSTWLLQ